MAFSTLGLIDGITGSIVVILGIAFGIFFYYMGKKNDVKFLTRLCFISLFAGLLYLGLMVDFIHVLIFQENFPNDLRQVALLSYIWFPPVMIAAIYMATEVLSIQRKTIFFVLYMILGAIFIVLIFIDPINSFYSSFYEEETMRLIDYNINISSLAGIFLALMLIPVILLLGVKIMLDAFKSTGALRTKFILLSLGAFFYGIFGLLEGFTQPGLSVIIVRIGYLSSFWLMYFGLKPIKV